MSAFVNFNKRAVTLPPECKDLMDVLQGTRAARAKLLAAKIRLTGKGEVNGPIDLSGLNAQQFRIHKEGFASGGLAQAERFVTRLMTAPRQIVEDRDLILRESRAAATLRYNSAEKVLWCAIETSGND